MKRLQIAAALLLALGSTAYAAGGRQAATTSGMTDAQTGVLAEEETGTGATSATSHLVQNSAECSPAQAEPVWSANDALLGYTCVEGNSN